MIPGVYVWKKLRIMEADHSPAKYELIYDSRVVHLEKLENEDCTKLCHS